MAKNPDSADIISPEKRTWKKRIEMEIDMKILQKLSLRDQIGYLALCGWRIELESRSGSEYVYAIKYINREKKRIYVGSAKDVMALAFPEIQG